MQTNTQQYIDKAKKEGLIVPRLSLAERTTDEYGNLRGTKSTGKHKVKYISDQVIKEKEYQTQNEIMAMKYIFEEDGAKYFYTRPLRSKDGGVHYFVERMNAFNFGDILILEYVPKGLNGFISAELASKYASDPETPEDSVEGDKIAPNPEVESGDIPVIQEGEPSKEQIDEMFGKDN